ncbi:TetR/AcrR family transcriptional regulator [Nocardioides mangrovicus]|uniref:TetR/AcrR family transcriptional regulator n=1 Tax=Nocardioides mangrovicus TaxID=2478913 RepID=UPI001314D213|nr:TetR/AcrR family transcriptional regulator [Nocardioides mangrovicus]
MADVASRTGRPRRADVEAAVLDATAALVGDRAYAQVTIDAIAARAVVAKTTIYRRWSSKAELAVDALARTLGDPPVDDRDGATAVRAAVGWLAGRVREPDVRHLLVGLVDEAGRDPELRARLRARIRDPFTQALCERWEVEASVVDLVVDVVLGAVLHRIAMSGDIGDGDVESVVDLAVHALFRGPTVSVEP